MATSPTKILAPGDADGDGGGCLARQFSKRTPVQLRRRYNSGHNYQQPGSMVTERLFSDDELTALGRSPWVTVKEAIEAKEIGVVESIVADLEAGFRSQIDRYTGWIASISQFAVEEWSHQGATAMARATRVFFATSPDIAEVGGEDPDPIAAEVAAAAMSDDSRVAIGLFDEMTERWRRSIDLHRDWISALLGSIYVDHGPRHARGSVAALW